jgi:peptidoglycan-associated lipoprotein
MRNFTLLLLLAGCASKPEVKPEAKPDATQSSIAPAAAPVAAAADKSCSADLECGDKQLCLNHRCVDINATMAECTQVRVHFPFNSSEMDPSELPSLQRSARCLKADSALKITIEGNADERGTEEYNLALGDQRAHTVASYLQSLGASQAQLKTVSYGKENPVCNDHNEMCWAKNRRAELSSPAGKKKSN